MITKGEIKEKAESFVLDSNVVDINLVERVKTRFQFKVTEARFTNVNKRYTFVVDYSNNKIVINREIHKNFSDRVSLAKAIGHISLYQNDTDYYTHELESDKNILEVKDRELEYFAENLLLPDKEVYNILEEYEDLLKRPDYNPHIRLAEYYRMPLYLFLKRLEDVAGYNPDRL